MNKRKLPPVRRRVGRPPIRHIPSVTLFGYLDKQLGPVKERKVLSHLRGCETCKKSLREAYAILQGMDNYAEKNRRECPSPEMMRDYEKGTLSKEEHNSVQKHLSECPYCIDFEEIYRLLEKESPKKG